MQEVSEVAPTKSSASLISNPVILRKAAMHFSAYSGSAVIPVPMQQERDRNFCVWCFKPVFLDVLVERLQGIAGSIISDIRRMKEGNP